MRSNPIDRWRHFRADVDREITFLLNRFGDEAYQMALQAANKPNLRSRRRKVLKAAAKALNPAPRFLGVFKLPPPKAIRPQLRAGPTSAPYSF